MHIICYTVVKFADNKEYTYFQKKKFIKNAFYFFKTKVLICNRSFRKL